jgi:dipeptidyl aminopeptidase/acylaminoacyl peptidase
MLALLFLGLVIIAPLVWAQEAGQSEREAMYYRYLEWPQLTGGSVEPHWMADGSSFWYAERAPANTLIWKVDPRANTKTPLFETERLRAALKGVLGQEPPHEGLPFEEFTFTDAEETAVEFAVGDERFVLQLDTYTISQVPALSKEEESRLVPQITRRPLYGWPETDVMEVLSPDGRWFAGIRNHNIWLRSTSDGRRVQLTTDGVEDYEWGERMQDPDRWAWWSPTSSKLAVKKEDRRKVPSVPIVDWLGPTEEVTWVNQVLCRPRGPCAQTELFVIDIRSKRQVRIDTGEEADQHFALLRWRPDGSELFFLRMNREFNKLDLMVADSETGASRVILTETQKTFVMGWEFDDAGWLGWLGPFTLLEDGERFIWASERDGWRHLYLYSIDGTLIRRLTEGLFPVVGGITVDEEAGWVYFYAHGDRQRPYDLHLYRVSLDGTGFTSLTNAPGGHEIQFAPSNAFFLNTHSSVDRPPVVELRRADGTLLQVLSKANIDALEELKWSPPEEFVVKAADGTTDLYGILYKPYDFDPDKRYPVIEHIYAHPCCTDVPRTFTSNYSGVPAQALAQLGFIAFIVDGRGTPERGKEFLDVVYGNIGRHEIPDQVAALEQLAAERPYMDLTRVGVWGGSGGGYSTIRAMLQAPDVYHVGIAANPDVERYDHGGDVPYMGLPEKNKEGYDYGSNIRLAGDLKGKLLLIQSTADPHGTFAWTMKLVDALIQAGKPYDLLVLPDQGHMPSGMSLTYMQEAIRRYFQEHLKPELSK